MVSTELLRHYPLFAGQSQYMLGEIARISEEVTKAKGEWLFHEYEDATRFYLVLDGAVALTLFVNMNDKEQHLSTSDSIGQREIIGWSSIVPPHQYKTGAMAVEDTRLLEIDAIQLRELLDDNPEHGYYFLQQISQIICDRFMMIHTQILSLIPDTESTPIP